MAIVLVTLVGDPGRARLDLDGALGSRRQSLLARGPSERQFWFKLGFLMHGFWAGRKSSILGVWLAPAAPKTIPEGGGLRPPPFGMVFGAAEAPKRLLAGPNTVYKKPQVYSLSRFLLDLILSAVPRSCPLSHFSWVCPLYPTSPRPPRNGGVCMCPALDNIRLVGDAVLNRNVAFSRL